MVQLSNARGAMIGDFVSVREAALRAKISEHTLYRWIRTGDLPAYCRGHATRVKMSEVLTPKTRKSPRRSGPLFPKRPTEQRAEHIKEASGRSVAKSPDLGDSDAQSTSGEPSNPTLTPTESE